MLLTPNGNILWHGKDPSAENKNVMAVEDSRGKKVVQELLAQAEGGAVALSITIGTTRHNLTIHSTN